MKDDATGRVIKDFNVAGEKVKNKNYEIRFDLHKLPLSQGRLAQRINVGFVKILSHQTMA